VSASGSRVGLRRAAGTDEPFLHRLYADRRAPELGTLGWTADEEAAFIDHQFRAQQDGYGAAFPDADHWIVVGGGDPIGRLLVDTRPAGHLVVDLVLHTAWRGQGIGTTLMQGVLDDAAAAGVPVRLTVAVNAPHLVRWYERLGFSVVDAGDVHVRMAWTPGGG